MSNNQFQSFSAADFDTIKQSLLNFLQGQSTFSGYNFTGSNLNILVDLLAYNAYNNLLYKNLALNEQFLQTAQLRNTVVERCNELGYLPISAKSASTTVNIHVSNNVFGNPSQLILPALSGFSTSVNGKTFTFYNQKSYTASVNADGSYDFYGVTLTEGTPLSISYINTGSSDQQFLIPNQNCDLSTVSVLVQTSSSNSNTTVYASVLDLTAVNSTTPVFFVRETYNQLYEIFFGINGFGVGVSPGNIIQISYFVSSMDAANGATSFSFVGGTLNNGTMTITATAPAGGGAQIESLQSIKSNAPLQYMAQNRAVTAADYSTLTQQIYPSANSISVWGGEDNNPPQYGNVYICIAPNGKPSLTSNEKNYVIQQLQNKSMLTDSVNIVDPDYINIIANVTVYYNPLKTTLTPYTLTSNIATTINTFITENLGTFSSVFRISNFQTAIDATDPSILNDVTTIVLQRPIRPSIIYYNSYANYSFVLGNPIESTGSPQNAVISSGFYIYGDTQNIYYIDDDGVGNLRLFYYDSAYNKVIVNSAIGSVQYFGGTPQTNGVISINNLNITQIVGNQFVFTFKPQSYDVVGYQSQVLQLLPNNATISVVAEAVSPVASGNSNYQFTSIRS